MGGKRPTACQSLSRSYRRSYLLLSVAGFYEVTECAALTINSNIPPIDDRHATNKPESRAVFHNHNQDVTTVLGDDKPLLANKQNQQQLMDDTNINLIFAALEGMHTVKALLAATVFLMKNHSNPIVSLIVECLALARDKIEWCTSVLKLACSNTASRNVQDNPIKSLARR